MGHGSRIQRSHLWLILFYCVSEVFHLRGDEEGPLNSLSRIVSSVSYSETKLVPYASRYIRVDLPAWFSSVSVALQSDADYDGGVLKMSMPMVCLRDGSLPLPDMSDNVFKEASSFNTSSSTQISTIQNMEHCIPLERNMTIKLTNAQVSPGALYIGIFNGVGSVRTQSKMINRGSTLTYTAAVSIEECISSVNWGPYCNEKINPLSCALSQIIDAPYNDPKPADTITSCTNAFGRLCHKEKEPKIYFIDILEVSDQLSVSVKDIGMGEASALYSTRNASEVILMCYVRHDAMPLQTLYDFSGNISDAPLLIHAPTVGRWFITVIPIRLSHVGNERVHACYSLEAQIRQCPHGKAGKNCIFGRYPLQTYIHSNPSRIVDFYYQPLGGSMSTNAAGFSLESLLKNSSGLETDPSWTYFLIDVPKGAAGYNIQVTLMSDKNINYEIYSRYGGLPSSQSWDYFYSNSSSNSDGVTFFKLYVSSPELVRFYILYAREGTWVFGLRNLTHNTTASQSMTHMSISLDMCPNKCSNHGSCNTNLDSTGLTLYSFCACDRNHGGFDCSVVLVTPQGHFWQSFLLIASNAAALFPAFWALYQRSLADWFLFMASGISSALYHACDVGTSCVLEFHVLQFMDFWLSFMAVVSTFVYLTTISESSKRTILTAVWVLTALMAATGATRASNLTLILVIGVVGLLVGWAIELTAKYRMRNFSLGCSPHMIRRHNIEQWMWNLFKSLLKRYRWGFLLAGSISFALAAISWTEESSETYWIWHSIWHLSIYTTSFLFLCSKVNIDRNEEPLVASYELQRQNSNPRTPQIL